MKYRFKQLLVFVTVTLSSQAVLSLLNYMNYGEWFTQSVLSIIVSLLAGAICASDIDDEQLEQTTLDEPDRYTQAISEVRYERRSKPMTFKDVNAILALRESVNMGRITKDGAHSILRNLYGISSADSAKILE